MPNWGIYEEKKHVWHIRTISTFPHWAICNLISLWHQRANEKKKNWKLHHSGEWSVDYRYKIVEWMLFNMICCWYDGHRSAIICQFTPYQEIECRWALALSFKMCINQRGKKQAQIDWMSTYQNSEATSAAEQQNSNIYFIWLDVANSICVMASYM